MGGVRDDLTIHEKALDVLIELLKKEQVGVARKVICPILITRVYTCTLTDNVVAIILTHALFLQLDESVPLHGIDKAVGHFEVHMYMYMILIFAQ